MNRRTFFSSFAIITALCSRPVYATAKIARIGWLTAQQAASLTPFLRAFQDGLSDLGYREGETLEIDYRYGDDDIHRVAPLALELASKPVDVLVVQGAAVPLVYELRLSVPSVYVFI